MVRLLRDARRRFLALAGVGESIAMIHDLLTSIREYQRNTAADVGGLLEIYRNRGRDRHCTVILLWNSDDPAYPGFASTTVLVPERGSASVTMHLHIPVPVGAWLIGFNCYLQTVLVGNDMMDVAMPERSPMCRLARAIPLGVLVRATVVPA